jgi:hypothetical protein
MNANMTAGKSGLTILVGAKSDQTKVTEKRSPTNAESILAKEAHAHHR